MKRKGNTISNRTYNPQNRKPQIPLDVDEVDTALEKFIRQKYDQQTYSSGVPRPAVRHDTGSTRSSDDQPPPLPPKPGKRFGFGLRSVSSALPLGRSRRITPPDSPDLPSQYDAPPSPIRVNKQSRVFGASVGSANGEDLELKLAALRDMGFPDDKRNASILKGLGGNLERSIEALVRLGEGSTPIARSRTPAQIRNVAVSQPLPSKPVAQTAREVSSIKSGHDAFEPSNQTILQSPPDSQGGFADEQINRSFNGTLSQKSNRSFCPSNPFQPRPYNPFEASTAPSSATFQLEKAFDSMQVSQPLFPNATGGYPQPQHQIQDIRHQHSMTPPVPHVPQQYSQYTQQPQPNGFSNWNYNPFMRSLQPETQATMNASVAASQSNPFMNAQSTMLQSPTFEHPIQQAQSNLQPLQQFSAPRTFTPQFTNPYMSQQPQTNQEFFHSAQIQQYTQPPSQPLQSQPTGRFDKSSILALYNYPQLAPPPLQNISEDAMTQSSTIAEPPTSQYPTGLQAKQGQRSATMPVQMVSGSKNPFHSATTGNSEATGAPSPTVNGAGMSRHVSQESVDITGHQSGRSVSPDAFASLSARYVR